MIPTSEEALAEAVKSASGPFAVRGNGSAGVVSDHPVLTAKGLTGVSLYEPGALTLVVKAGTPVSEVETVLAAENQRLAFEPMNLRGIMGGTEEGTIGGVVASNRSGPRRLAVGACRDFALGVRFVDGMGRIIKNGGRVMKNVTGYDLVKLMAGSHGTLGVLTEVSLKVLPMPETSATLTLHGLSDAQAVAAMSKALGSPYEVTGAAHAPVGPDGSAVTVLRLEGFEESVSYRAAALQGFLGLRCAQQIEADAAIWEWVRDAQPMHYPEGNVWRLSVKPSDAPDVVARVPAQAALYDWGGGLIWLRCAEDVDVRAHMAGVDGHATLVRGASFARFHPQSAGVAALSKGLRLKFDPKGLLNPGLMG